MHFPQYVFTCRRTFLIYKYLHRFEKYRSKYLLEFEYLDDLFTFHPEDTVLNCVCLWIVPLTLHVTRDGFILMFYFSFYNPALRRIRAGSAHRNTGGIVIHVQREFNHPSYRVAARYDADITVIRLASFLTFGPAVQQARLMPPGSHVPDNSAVVHAGWGDTIVSHFDT